MDCGWTTTTTTTTTTTVRPVFKSLIWKSGSRPWDIFKGHLEGNISDASGIRDPEISRIEIMRADRIVPRGFSGRQGAPGVCRYGHTRHGYIA